MLLDKISAIETGKLALSTMDMTAAFDIVDHVILLSRLKLTLWDSS